MAIKELRLPDGSYTSYDDEELDVHEAARRAVQLYPEAFGITPPKEEPSALRRLPDIGVAALKSAVALPETLVGLADIPTGGAVGKGLEDLGIRFAETQKFLDDLYSPQQKAANEAVRNADGFINTIAAAAKNPSSVAAVVGESIFPMIGGGLGARGIAAITGASKVLPWMAGAGEGAMMAGSAAEQIRQQTPGGTLTPAGIAAAAGTGVGGAVFGTMGGRFLNKMGVADIDTAIAQGALPKTASPGFMKRIALGGISEGAFEEMPQSIQEQMWQNYALGRPIDEGVGNVAAMGLVSGAAMGAPMGVFGGQPTPAPAAPPAPPEFTLTPPTPQATVEEKAAPPAVYNKAHANKLVAAGADQETATLAALSTETAKRNYNYLRSIGMDRNKAITQAVTNAQELAPPGQLSLFNQPPAAPAAAAGKTEAVHPFVASIKENEDLATPAGVRALRSKAVALSAPDDVLAFLDAKEQEALQNEVRASQSAFTQEGAPVFQRNPPVGTTSDMFTGAPGAEPRIATPTAPIIPERIDHGQLIAAGFKSKRSRDDFIKAYSNKDFATAEVDLTEKLAGDLSKKNRTNSEALLRVVQAARQQTEQQQPEPEVSDFAGREFRGQGKLLAPSGRAKTAKELGYAVPAQAAAQAPVVEPQGEMAAQTDFGADWVAQAAGEQPTEGEQDAIQEPVAGEGVLRGEETQPKEQVELQGVDEGVPTDEIPAQKGEGQAIAKKVKRARSTAEAIATIAAEKETDALVKEFETLRDDPNTGPKTKRAAQQNIEYLNEFTKGKGEVAHGQYTDQGTTLEDKQADIRYGKKTLEELKKFAEFSRGVVRNPSTKAEVEARIKSAFNNPKKMEGLVHVVGTIADIPKELVAQQKSLAHPTTSGFTAPDGSVWLVAENINKGEELGIFLHELGVHIGMPALLGESRMLNMARKIAEWAQLGDESVEAMFAKEAISRTNAAKAIAVQQGDPFTDDDFIHESIAYFVQSAVDGGLDPTALESIKSKSLKVWFADLMNAVKAMLKTIWVDPSKISAQDVVDLAYGAAGIELSRGATDAEMPVRFSRTDGRVSAILGKMGNAAPEGSDVAKYAAMVPFTRDLVLWAEKQMPSASGVWEAINNALSEIKGWSVRLHSSILQPFLDMDEKAKHNVQKFLFDGKFEGKWGFQPDWIKEPVEISETMRDKWKALTNDEKQIAKNTLQLFHDLREQDLKAIKDHIEGYKRIAAKMSDEKTKKQAEADVNEQLKALRMLNTFKGPYIPTVRFGDYTVESKSKEYVDAENSNDRKKMEELKYARNAEGRGVHYDYAEFNSAREANQYKKEMEARAEFSKGVVRPMPKIKRLSSTKADFTALSKLETLIAQGTTDREISDRMRAALHALYGELANEYSEAQSRREFKGVSGAKPDEVMRGVALRATQLAYKIANTKNARLANNSFSGMREEIDKAEDPAVATHLLDEMQKRYFRSAEGYDISDKVQKVMSGVSFFKLLTNPVYYLTQLVQPFQYSIPSMVKYGFGYMDSWNEMRKITTAIGEVAKQSRMFSRIAENLSWVKDDDERKMLEWLREQNLLDMGMESEMGALEGAGKVELFLERNAVRPLRNAVQNVEIVNRVSTALATYRMAKNKGMTEQASRKAAYDVVYYSHGMYSGENAPRYLNQRGFMRVPMQFRKFQLIQATFLYRNLMEELAKLKDPNQRKAAAATIAATLGHTLAVAGLKGSVLWMLVSLLMPGGGDDDPRDEETKTHDYLAKMVTPEFADLVMYGLPTAVGVNVSARLAQNPLTIMPFDNQTLLDGLMSKKDLQKTAYTLVTGATGALAADIVDGMNLVQDGKISKGMEKMSPSMVKNLIQASEYATEGATRKDGTVTLTPEEIGVFGVIQKAIGLPPAVVKEAERKQGAVIEVDRAFREQMRKLQEDYDAARKDGDVRAAQRTINDWYKMQSAMKKLGLKPYTLQSLTNKRAREVQEGVVLPSKGYRGFTQSMQ